MTRSRLMKETGVRSPCLSLCALDEEQICMGCRRSLQEILAWPKASDPERLQIYANIKQRKAAEAR